MGLPNEADCFILNTKLALSAHLRICSDKPSVTV